MYLTKRVHKSEIATHRGPVMTTIMCYQVVFQRNCLEIETMCWNGSLDETIRLARRIASHWEADIFRIDKFAESGATVYWEARAAVTPDVHPFGARIWG